MRGTTWLALAATVLVLISASALSRLGSLPKLGALPKLDAMRLPAMPDLSHLELPSLSLQLLARHPNTAAASALALGASALAACIVRRRRTRGRRRTVRLLRLARTGHGTARIARETRLAQDAVRSLLHPGFPRRRVERANARRRTTGGRKDLPDRQLRPVALRGARPHSAGVAVARTTFERTVS